jgi:hypothetical protein
MSASAAATAAASQLRRENAPAKFPPADEKSFSESIQRR